MTTPNSSAFVSVAVVFLMLASIVGIAVFLRFAAPDLVSRGTRKDRRWGANAIAFVPLWLVMFAHFGHSHLDKAGPVGLCLYMMGAIAVFSAWLWFWQRHVPVKVTLCIGAIIWAVTLWLAFTDRLV